MARRRTRSHLELREQFDAAERVKEGEEAEETEDEEDDEEEEEAAEGEEAPEADADADADDEDGGDEDDEDAPKKKKKKKKVVKPVKEAKPKRTRTPKVVRMKVVWAVFNNSNQRIATYDYPKRQEADDHAARMTTEKKTTFFVQPIKEPIEEKKAE